MSDSDDSGQNADINKSIDNIKKSDFIITVLKDRISILEQQLVEKNAIIDFFCKTEDITHSNVFRYQ